MNLPTPITWTKWWLLSTRPAITTNYKNTTKDNWPTDQGAILTGEKAATFCFRHLFRLVSWRWRYLRHVPLWRHMSHWYICVKCASIYNLISWVSWLCPVAINWSWFQEFKEISLYVLLIPHVDQFSAVFSVRAFVKNIWNQNLFKNPGTSSMGVVSVVSNLIAAQLQSCCFTVPIVNPERNAITQRSSNNQRFFGFAQVAVRRHIRVKTC